MPSRFATRLIVAVTVTVADCRSGGGDRRHQGRRRGRPERARRTAAGTTPSPPVKTRHVQPGPKHPNIVLILTDDQRWDTLWSMPNVQKLLVDHGVTFANAFVTNSFCCPSRSTILTGNYSHTTGIYGNHPPHGGAVDFHRYGDDKSTIATWLHKAGYNTALVGKYLNGYQGPFIPPGWDTWDAFDYGFGYYGFDLYQNQHPPAVPRGLQVPRHLPQVGLLDQRARGARDQVHPHGANVQADVPVLRARTRRICPRPPSTATPAASRTCAPTGRPTSTR